MNKIWLIMLLFSLTILLFIDPNLTMTGLINASNKAVKLSFELCAVYAIWIGIFSILEQTGISKKITKLLSPIIDIIFGKNNLSKESKEYVTLNISANMLGMNGAATPMGIKAIEQMSKDDKSGKVTFPMTMLIMISCSSIQLLPTSIIGLLTNAGATSPSSIIMPSIIASIISTMIAIVLAKVWNRIQTRKQIKGKK